MKTLLLTMALSLYSFANCNFEITQVSGCVRGNMYGITHDYLKYSLKEKGYDLNASESNYEIDVFYACGNSIRTNYYGQGTHGVHITIKHKDSYFEENFFSPNNDLYGDFQALQNATAQIPFCVN